MKKTADVVVIGGGINGCSVAYHLAKNGIKKVIQLERRFIASGPTGRSSGVVRQHYTIQTLAKMAKDSMQIFQHFEEEVGGSAGFVQTGVVFIVSEENAAALRSTVEMHHRLGIRTSVLSPEELARMEPFLYYEDLACGAYEPDGGYADPALAANSFCEAARRAGVEVCQRTLVTGLKMDREQIRAVVTSSGEEIVTRTLINVAGPWGGEISAMAGVHIPITPSRHPVVLLQRPAQWRSQTPVWVDLVNGGYFKPEGRAGILVGSIEPKEGEIRADLESYPETPNYDEIAAYSETLMKRFPIMSEGVTQGGWAGLYDVTPDWMPVIDAIPERPGFYCAVGFSGHGFKLAPAVGTIMAELVLEGKSRTYDTSVFRFKRFEEGQLTHSQYEYSIVG
jgi:sarcosine oxidase subunit beta